MVPNSFKHYFPLFALLWGGLPYLWILPFGISFFYLGLILITALRKFYNNNKDHRRFFKFGVLLAIFWVFIEYRTFLRYEAAAALVMLVTALKTHVYRKPQEFRIIAFMLIFLTACTSLFFQNTFITLHILLSFLWIGIILLETSRPAFEFSGLIDSGMQVLTYLFKVLPIIIIVYLFFPRYEEALFSIYRFKQQAKTGISGEVYPGIVRQIVEDETLAFRAYVDSFVKVEDLYWRVLTLSYTDGTKWRESILDKTSIPSKIKAAKNSESVKQEIILEPLLKNYLVGLDVPRYLNTLSATGFRVEKVASQTFRLNRELNTRLKYTVVSQSYAITNSMDQDEKIYSWIPEKLTGNVRQLAAKWKKNSHGDEDYLHNILQYFTNNLVYTLEPGKFSKQHDFLNELLFNVKKGFCEHFASAFALLAREKGIPTRLVVGYHGGEFNPYGRYWMVRQKNAHVWVEVFLAKKGWMRIDPTFYIKPERIQSGHYDFDHYHLLHKLSFYPYVHTMALRFDDINTRWNKFLLWINVSFQEKVFKDNGALTITSYQLTGIIILSVLLSIFLLFIVWQKPFLKFMDESLDAQIVRIYKQGLKKIGNKHIVKQRSEGPHAFLRRIELKDKALALRLKPFFQTYVKLRYTDMQITRVHVKKLRSIVRQMRL